MQGDAEMKDDRRPFRRHVFYIHGFDPRGPAPYHGFFTAHAGEAGRRWERQIEVSRRSQPAPHVARWAISSKASGAPSVQVTYELLRWDDEVRRLWAQRRPAALIGQSFRVLWAYARSGFMGEIYRPARAAFFSVLTPPLLFTLFALASLGVGFLGVLVGGILGRAAELPAEAVTAVQVFAALLALFLVLLVWRHLARRAELWWLTRCLDYLWLAAHGDVTRSEKRADEFAQRLGRVAAEPALDEIVVVGHSLGALHAVRMVAKALRAHPDLGLGREGPRLLLLFLGQSIPSYTVYERDPDFVRDLIDVTTSERATVIDVTSGSDTGSACRVDLLHRLDVGGRVSRHRQERPPFHQLLTPQSFRSIRKNPRAYHFQYLKPSERGSGFDYFELLTRPEVLTTTRAVP